MKKKLILVSSLLAATLCFASCSTPDVSKKSDKDEKSKIEKNDDEVDETTKDNTDEDNNEPIEDSKDEEDIENKDAEVEVEDDVEEDVEDKTEDESTDETDKATSINDSYNDSDILAWKLDAAQSSISFIQELAIEDMFSQLFFNPTQDAKVESTKNDIHNAKLSKVYVVDMSENNIINYRSHITQFSDLPDYYQKLSEPAKAIFKKDGIQLITNTVSVNTAEVLRALSSSLASVDYRACDMVFDNEVWLFETDKEGIGFCIYFQNEGEGVVAVTSTVFFHPYSSIEQCFDEFLVSMDMNYEILDTNIDTDYEAKSPVFNSYSDDEIFEWKTKAAKAAFDDVLALASDDYYLQMNTYNSYINNLDLDFREINPSNTAYVVDTSREGTKNFFMMIAGIDETLDSDFLTDSVLDLMYRSSGYLVQAFSSYRDINHTIASTSLTTVRSYATDMDFESETWIVKSDTNGFAVSVNFLNFGDGVIAVTGMPFFGDDIATQLSQVYMEYKVIDVDLK